MMCPCGVVDPSLRSGEVAAPPRPRPRVERGRDSSRGRGRALGSSEAELPVAPEAELDRCRFRPGGWHNSQSGAGGAVFLSDRSVKGRSDCGHFDLAD
jgi:hypothetical protein